MRPLSRANGLQLSKQALTFPGEVLCPGVFLPALCRLALVIEERTEL
ncbi:hypothetical protein ACFSC4_23430 [Deinococcus malanensis]